MRVALARGSTVEHLTLDQGVPGSNPGAPANPPHDARVDPRTIRDEVIAFEDHLRAKKTSPRTIESDGESARQLIDCLARMRMPLTAPGMRRELPAADVEAFLADWSDYRAIDPPAGAITPMRCLLAYRQPTGGDWLLRRVEDADCLEGSAFDRVPAHKVVAHLRGLLEIAA